MSTGVERVVRLLEAAREIADPSTDLGRDARTVLPVSTGLSPEGVELALLECLEHRATSDEIALLAASVPSAVRAHVILARTVFTAPLRAIALALAQTEDVCVRPSRHEPQFTRLLATASAGLFRVVDEIAPAPADHVWIYGGKETIDELHRSLPEGCVLHAHGPGFGVAVVGANLDASVVARALTDDVVPFDQRGCLSPRIAIVVGPKAYARQFAAELALCLGEAESRVPLGDLSAEEATDVVRYRDTVGFAGEILAAGRGFVGVGELALVAPVGRNMHVVAEDDLEELLASLRDSIAALGVMGTPDLEQRVKQLLPRARPSALGSMQRPRFDGAVDLRRGR